MTQTLVQPSFITVIADDGQDSLITVAFTPTVTSGTSPLTVDFDNGSDNATDYLWDFGDGYSSTIMYASHVYELSGTYTVTLQSSNDVMTETLVKTNLITVMPAPVSTPQFYAEPRLGTVPLTVTFTSETAIETRKVSDETRKVFKNLSCLDQISYVWDFGDGQTSTEITPTRVYTAAGDYTVSLQASNGLETETRTHENYIRVFDDAPIVYPVDLEAGLQGYWTLDEEGGLRYDSSGSGNDLQDHNGVTAEGGQVGLAASFDRDEKQLLYIEDADQVGLDDMQQLTFTGWFKADHLNITQVIAGKHQANDRAYRLYISDENVHGLQFAVSDDGHHKAEIETGAVLSENTWHHVAAIFDGEMQRLAIYVDGSLANDADVDIEHINDSGTAFGLGGYDSNPNSKSHRFDGLLDEWRVYNRVLNPTEIAELSGNEPGDGGPWDELGIETNITPAGGVLTSADGRLTIEFAPGAITEDLHVSIGDSWWGDVVTDTNGNLVSRELVPNGLPFRMFSLNAWRLNEFEPHDVYFQAPVTLTYQYIITEVDEMVQESLTFLYHNPELEKFETISTTVYTETMQMTAVITHFSKHGVAGDNAGWITPGIDAFGVQLSKGSATYSYGIPVPVAWHLNSVCHITVGL